MAEIFSDKNMQNIIFAVIGMIILAMAVRLVAKFTSKRKYPYESKMLLTKTEYGFYLLLKERCDNNNLLICPKVRLEDFIKVTKTENIQKYRGYIKSRHVDFLICDSMLHILAGLELDDSSHESKPAKETDAFKDKLFETIGIPLYRIPAKRDEYDRRIKNLISDII